jgi:hypothetical protein
MRPLEMSLLRAPPGTEERVQRVEAPSRARPHSMAEIVYSIQESSGLEIRHSGFEPYVLLGHLSRLDSPPFPPQTSIRPRSIGTDVPVRQ